MKIIEITNVDFALRQFLLPLMREMRNRGHEVIGACADGPLLNEVRSEGFRIVTIPFERRMSPVAHWRAFRALLRLFRTEKPDMVHAHMPISSFLARLAAWSSKVPCIACTCHGFWFNRRGNPIGRIIAFLMEWVSGRVTDIFMTVSHSEANIARRLGIHHRARAVGNGRDPSVFRPDLAIRARVRAQMDLPGDRLVVVAVSRLVREKGYAELAEAMRELPQADLWVVGERLHSDRGDDMTTMLRQSGLGARLHLLGYRSDVSAVLAAADIFVLPSYFEGLPMSVIEAMLTGLPVIATDISGPREQIVPGVTGLLVPPREVRPLVAALHTLAIDPELRASLGTAGRARARDFFDEEKVLTRTLAQLGLGNL